MDHGFRDFRFVNAMGPSLVACQERTRLIQDFSQSARDYASLVNQMADLVGSGLQSEVLVVRRAARRAWEKLEEAKLALYRHEADHGCDRFALCWKAGSGRSG